MTLQFEGMGLCALYDDSQQLQYEGYTRIVAGAIQVCISVLFRGFGTWTQPGVQGSEGSQGRAQHCGLHQAGMLSNCTAFLLRAILRGACMRSIRGLCPLLG